ncbi:hypothetical protein IV203_033614 [Nitzschia inconspicua]|uniref:Uncharacterized protein n=1 Tax=Nitzschia inconspicua TaxID=303405 RepID=A0A9K3M2P1_9STRA|nr:hypothetical protein IV203_033614 [Nitzschia inconspicua]
MEDEKGDGNTNNNNNKNNNNKDDQDDDTTGSTTTTTTTTTATSSTTTTATTDDDDLLSKQTKNAGLKRLAELSLQDYQWRSDVWKTNQADRQVEQSLARMMGEENASYVRPMDASERSIGPLGVWEKTSVEWLSQVLEEEAHRAEQIVRLGGSLVRPMDQLDEDGRQLGPLGQLERRLVNFFESIRLSETERTKNAILRPKDLDASKRGPLGEAELQASQALQVFFQSEQIRAQLQSKIQDSIVRPIDVPGPLGDFEMAVLQIVQAEEQRQQQYKAQLQDEDGIPYSPATRYRPIRPMNANVPGPLGELEQQATEFVQRLTQEEKQRLRNIQKYLDDNRPMTKSRSTMLGTLETVVVGIVRAPILLYQIVRRVQTLLESEPLDEIDAEILLRLQQQQQDDDDDADGRNRKR